MKRYGQYRSTQYDWLPQVPQHWTPHTLRALTVVSDERNGSRNSTLLSVYREYGVIPKSSRDDNHNVESEDLSNYKYVRPGYLVMNKMKMWQGSLGISTYEGIVSPAYIVCRIEKELNLKYLHLLLRSEPFKTYYNRISYGVRVGQWDMHYSDLKQLTLYLPPRDEQDQIVRYLDWQTSRIDKLINAKKKQIALLEEQKNCVINDAVTKGLLVCNHKRVQANWLAEIPQHWEFDKVKQHFHIKKEIAGKEGYDVLSITQQGLKVKDISTNEGQMAASYAKYQFVHPGDFAMNHMDLLTGYIGLSDRFGVTSPDYRVFALDDTEHCDPEYFLHVFQLAYKRKIFYGLGQGAANKGRWRMPAENFKNFDIPVPPLDEQRKIVAYIKEQTAKIDKLIPMLDKQIDILHEYRVCLVSDVVTGQVDVRNMVIPEYGRIEEYNIKSEILTDTEDTTEDV